MRDLQALTDDELLLLKKQTEQKIAEYNNAQMAMKILLNGGYGAMSNEHNRWYSDDVAESITLSGQLSARWIIQHMNQYLNGLFKTADNDYVIACDTDSIHLDVSSVISRTFKDEQPTLEEKLVVLENFSKVLEKQIEIGYDLLAKELNVFESAMHMKLEAIAEAIWTGKKHYAMRVWVGEKRIRYSPPKLKLVGLEAVKSSTPQLIRNWMKELIPIILDADSSRIHEYIERKREEYKTKPFEEVAYPRSISDVEKKADPSTIYGKATPIHVRAALLYNHELKKRKLLTQLQPINSGDKIRFCYMKLPNPLNENVFACPDALPRELKDLEPYIDYNLQYEKSFVEPMLGICKAAGITVTDEVDMNQFIVGGI